MDVAQEKLKVKNIHLSDSRQQIKYDYRISRVHLSQMNDVGECAGGYYNQPI